VDQHFRKACTTRGLIDQSARAKTRRKEKCAMTASKTWALSYQSPTLSTLRSNSHHSRSLLKRPPILAEARLRRSKLGDQSDSPVKMTQNRNMRSLQRRKALLRNAASLAIGVTAKTLMKNLNPKQLPRSPNNLKHAKVGKKHTLTYRQRRSTKY